jgi:hypothetical protein
MPHEFSQSTPPQERILDIDKDIAKLFQTLKELDENYSYTPDDAIDTELRNINETIDRYNRFPLLVIVRNFNSQTGEFDLSSYTTRMQEIYTETDDGVTTIGVEFENIILNPDNPLDDPFHIYVDVANIETVAPIDLTDTEIASPDDAITKLNILTHFSEYLEELDMQELADRYNDSLDELDVSVRVLAQVSEDDVEILSLPDGTRVTELSSEGQLEPCQDKYLIGTLLGIRVFHSESTTMQELFAQIVDGDKTYFVPLSYFDDCAFFCDVDTRMPNSESL